VVRLLFTPRALADLAAIHGFVAPDSLERADSLIDRVKEGCRILRRWPELGRQRAELGLGVRSFPVGLLIVLYRLAGDDIEIVRIIDGRRDVAAAFFSSLVLLGAA
jgi:toxin ParE1/3/4